MSTGSALYSGVAGFLTLLPSALQFLVGPLVDRWSIRRTLVGTQAVQAVVVALVPVASVTGTLRVEVVLVVMPLLAALNQLVYPAQSAALPRLLDDEELVAANSAFTVAYQGLEMAANGVGGILIGLVGAVSLFVVDAVTFAVAALLFATVAVPTATTDSSPEYGDEIAADGGTGENPEQNEPESYLGRLGAGIRFIRGTFLVWLIAGAAVVNFTSGMTLAAMPAYADALGVPSALAAVGDAGGYGVLMAAFAAGNLVGATLVDDRRLGVTLVVAFASTSVLWTAGLVVGWLPLTAVLFALAAVPAGVVNVQLSAVVQSAPPEGFVGRVTSVLGSAASASIPVGALVGGTVAGTLGPGVAMAGFAVGGLCTASYTLAVPRLRGLPAVNQIDLDVGTASEGA